MLVPRAVTSNQHQLQALGLGRTRQLRADPPWPAGTAFEGLRPTDRVLLTRRPPPVPELLYMARAFRSVAPLGFKRKGIIYNATQRWRYTQTSPTAYKWRGKGLTQYHGQTHSQN